MCAIKRNMDAIKRPKPIEVVLVIWLRLRGAVDIILVWHNVEKWSHCKLN